MVPHIWPSDPAKKDHMIKRQSENLEFALRNPNENWMYNKLLGVRGVWHRQVVCEYRIFDFFNSDLGIAVEVDGSEHDKIRDAISDRKHFKKQLIRVLRVKNNNSDDAEQALYLINKSSKWEERKKNPPRQRLEMRAGVFVEKKPRIYGIFVPGKEPEFIIGKYKSAHKKVNRIKGAYSKRFKTLDEYYKHCFYSERK